MGNYHQGGERSFIDKLNDPGVDVIKMKVVKAKKEHKCYFCEAIIHPKETYQRMFGVEDGEAYSCIMCARCYKALSLVNGVECVRLFDVGTLDSYLMDRMEEMGIDIAPYYDNPSDENDIAKKVGIVLAAKQDEVDGVHED